VTKLLKIGLQSGKIYQLLKSCIHYLESVGC